MPIDDFMSKNRPRRPSLRGSLMLDISSGQERARAWPKKRGKPKSEKTREQNEWFRQAQWATKYWPPKLQIACAEAVKGTPLLPRDLMTMIMAGRFVQIGFEDGSRDLYSMAQLNDVSQSLDVITSEPGYTLIRGEDYWEGVPYGGGGGGGGAWAITASWDFAVDGPTSEVVANTAGKSEALVLFNDVTVATTGRRCALVSTDNGATYWQTNGDYAYMSASGVITNEPYISGHNTNSTGARSAQIILSGLSLVMPAKPLFSYTQILPQVFRATDDRITQVKALNSAGGNMTGGTVYILTR